MYVQRFMKFAVPPVGAVPLPLSHVSKRRPDAVVASCTILPRPETSIPMILPPIACSALTICSKLGTETGAASFIAFTWSTYSLVPASAVAHHGLYAPVAQSTVRHLLFV